MVFKGVFDSGFKYYSIKILEKYRGGRVSQLIEKIEEERRRQENGLREISIEEIVNTMQDELNRHFPAE